MQVQQMMKNNVPSLEITYKQAEYIRDAFNDDITKNHKWNFKIGATRSGKTHLDIIFTIPYRIRLVKGLPGLILIFGVSKTSIERNVLSPLREKWGDKLVGEINSENECELFGETCHCLGTEKANQVAKIRGLKAKYIYWDEICEANIEVFELVKSRIELDYACVDATANPKDPNHFVKKFIDKRNDPDPKNRVDAYVQEYTLFDNSFLSPWFVDELCREYAGTIYYDRYILGQWKRAEGAIFQLLSDKPQDYIITEKPTNIDLIVVGIDFGGNGSAHAFVAVGFTRHLRQVIVLNEQLIDAKITPEDLEIAFVQFAKKVYDEHRKAFMTYFDNAEPVLARGIASACKKAKCQTIVKPALKVAINDRIRTTLRLLGAKRFKIMKSCPILLKALQEAVWNQKSLEDERLDNGSYCMDIIDAYEYCIERYIKALTELS